MKRQRGYTLLEVMLVVAIAPILVSAIMKAVMSSRELAEVSRAELHAHEELRRNLEAIADIVRDADIETLGGFDGNGVAVHPTFQCVIGADAEGRLYDGLSELFWSEVDVDVDGVSRPGEVIYRKGGIDKVVAEQVPLGGFSVRLEGGTLVIRGQAYYATSERRIAQVSGETAVALRN